MSCLVCYEIDLTDSKFSKGAQFGDRRTREAGAGLVCSAVEIGTSDISLCLCRFGETTLVALRLASGTAPTLVPSFSFLFKNKFRLNT